MLPFHINRRPRGHNTILASNSSWNRIFNNSTKSTPIFPGTTKPDAKPDFLLERPTSRKGHNNYLESRNSLPILLGQNETPNVRLKLPQLEIKLRKGPTVSHPRTCGDHCREIRLPKIVDHVPKLSIKVNPADTDLKKSKKRSRQLKRKVLGSSEANLLPNRPVFPGNGNKRSDKYANDKQKVLPNKKPPTPRPDSPKCKSTPKKQAPGQVSLQPKLDGVVLKSLKSSCEELLKSATAKSPPKSQWTVSRKPDVRPVSKECKYSQMARLVPPPKMQPMVMERRSPLHKLILKPEVPSALQIVRRKTKFMRNQTLQDVYSLPIRRNSAKRHTNMSNMGGKYSTMSSINAAQYSPFAPSLQSRFPQTSHHLRNTRSMSTGLPRLLSSSNNLYSYYRS